MINTLVLHAQTKSHVAQFLASPSHAVLLIGADGMGKRHLAEAMASNILRLEMEKLSQYPYYLAVRSEKDSISIDAIRELQRFLQLRTLGDRPLRRAVIVERADTLTTEAQNAYLKLLEEPPADTLMILTASNQRALLPTILSRLQTITVHAPAEAETKQYFSAQGKAATSINQAYFLGGGLPGLMDALLSDNDTHPLAQGVATAKTILQKPVFERLALVDSLSKQKGEAVYAVEALLHIAHTGLDQAAAKGEPGKIKQWHHILKVASEAADALAQSANAKLVLSNLMLQI